MASAVLCVCVCALVCVHVCVCCVTHYLGLGFRVKLTLFSLILQLSGFDEVNLVCCN